MQAVQSKHQPYSAEAKLLLDCIRPGLSSHGYLHPGDCLQERIKWSVLYEMAFRHGIIPLLYKGLNTLGSQQASQGFMDKVRGFCVQNTGHSLLLTHRLFEILKNLKDHEITAVPFKGPVLSASLYGDVTQRTFGDLDIMVLRRDVCKAIHVLRSLGYQTQNTLARAQEAAHFQTQYALSLIHPCENFPVELHWDITPRYLGCSVNFESMWERLDTIQIGEQRVASFAPEDNLLILCIHGGKHIWERLGWITDISYLIKQHPGLKWDQIVEQARQSGCEKMIILGLSLVRDLLNTPLPPEVVAWIRKDPASKTLSRQVQREILETKVVKPRLFKYFLVQWKLRNRLRDRIRYALRFLSTPTVGDWLTFSLPSFLFPLYYMIRPARLLWKSLQR